jgi:hypothetical protein
VSTDEFDLTISDAARTPGRRKNNLTATAAPTATDDSADGYEVGSVWIDVTNDTAWTCVDSTATAAVWIQGGGAHDLEDMETDSSVSGSKTVDRDDAPNHYLVLTGNTVLDATSTTYTADLLSMLLFIQQDGTGGRTLDMSAFTWTDGEPVMPSGANDLLIVPIFSTDGGTTWIGITPGGDVTVELEDLTDVDLTAPTEGDTLVYRSGEWVNEPPGDPVTEEAVRDIGHWEVVVFGTAPPVAVSNPDDDDWVYAWVPG